MSSPLLWGPNNTANNLQNQILQANGALASSDGPLNYLSYNNFENNSTTGWSLGTVGSLTNGIPTGTPTFGSGASGNLTLSITSSAIAKTYSLSLASSAATTQGNMLASKAYTIDQCDQAKLLTWQMYFSVPVNPTNGNFSGTSSNTFGIAIWDDTNSSFLMSTGNFGMTQTQGVGYATGTCQTNFTTAAIRFILYCANASAGAITLYLDRFYLGPQTAPFGPCVTDMNQTYAATFGGVTVSANNSLPYMRIGDQLRVLGDITYSSVSGTTLSITLPSGLAIDSTKLGTLKVVGIYYNSTSSGTPSAYGSSNVFGPIFYDGSDTAKLYLANGGASSVPHKDAANGLLFGSGGLHVDFLIPIAGWSSNVETSNSTDTRVVACNVATSSTAQGFSSGSFTTATLATTIFDTHGAWDGTNTYTVPVSGFYSISGQLTFQGGGASTSRYIIQILKNSSEIIRGNDLQVPASQPVGMLVSGIVKCNAGETIQLQAFNSTGGSQNLSGSTAENYLSINRLSGPAVVAATETVSAKYYSNSATSVPGNQSNTIINFQIPLWDTHNAVTIGASWQFKAPVSGYYMVDAYNELDGSWASGDAAQGIIKINGANPEDGSYTGFTGTFSASCPIYYHGQVQMNAGDTLSFYAQSSRAGGSTTSGATRSNNHISIFRVK